MSIAMPVWGRRALRRLLQVDPPVPARSEAELTAEMYKNYRWNFGVNFLDGAWFWFGYSFISATTLLPLFVSKLTTNPFWIALLAVLAQAAWYLPQLFAANATERLSRKKPIVINLGFFTERLPVWLLPIAALLSVYSPPLALVIFFIAYAWHGLGAGLIAPAWSDMIARCFPVDKRGWYFGFTAFIGTGVGIFGAAFSSWLLANYEYPYNFAISFTLAAASITLSWAFLAMTREPVQRVPDTVKAQQRAPMAKTGAILKGDANYRQFLVARVLSNLGRMGAGFLTVAAITQWSVSDATVGIYTAALFLGQTIGNLLAGVVADRWGHKVVLELGQVMAIFGFGLAWLAPSPDWYYLIFFASGVAMGITVVSSVLIVMEFSKAEHRPTYVGIGNTVSGIASAVAPLIGGLLAVFHYDWVFLASAILSVAGLIVLRLRVTEPRRQTEFFEVNTPELPS
jgi:MFS family permease